MSVVQANVIDMIGKLVSFDTTSRDSNVALIEFVEQYLSDCGVTSQKVYSADGSKANLIATVGPVGVSGGVVLSGHSDVVPVDDQNWQTDPFVMDRRDERLYGRGTCDMKGFLATALALVPEFNSKPLKVPIHIILTYDEETDCGGAIRLMEALATMNLAPRAVIIGEPTEMTVINAHKGHFACETFVTGKEAHSSLPDLGLNAIEVTHRLISELLAIQDELKKTPSDIRGLDPAYTTINIGTVTGGTQFNIVPAHCRFQWDLRTIPEQDPHVIIEGFTTRCEAILGELKTRVPEADIRTEIQVSVPAFSPEDDSAAEKLVMSIAGTNETMATGFGTEAPCYQKAGMSVVVFGPGSIAQAHKPDEFIELAQVHACVSFLRKLSDRLCQSGD